MEGAMLVQEVSKVNYPDPKGSGLVVQLLSHF